MNRIKTTAAFSSLLPASGDSIPVPMFQDGGLWHHMVVRDDKKKTIAVISVPKEIAEDRPEYFKYVNE